MTILKAAARLPYEDLPLRTRLDTARDHASLSRFVSLRTFDEVCLAANSLRLQEMPATARSLLEHLHSESPAESAVYLRALALICWDQGRYDEMVGHLIRARDLFFQTSGQSEEAVAIDELLVLAYAELGERSASISFYSALPDPLARDRSRRPWLSARAAFTAAFAYGRKDFAAAEGALGLGSSLAATVQDDELLVLESLELRARAALGFDCEGALSALRDRALSAQRTFDTVLLTIDLLALRRALGRKSDDLFRPLALHESPLLPKDFLPFLKLAVEVTDDPWDIVLVLRRFTRRLFASSKLSIPPIPFRWEVAAPTRRPLRKRRPS